MGKVALCVVAGVVLLVVVLVIVIARCPPKELYSMYYDYETDFAAHPDLVPSPESNSEECSSCNDNCAYHGTDECWARCRELCG